MGHVKKDTIDIYEDNFLLNKEKQFKGIQCPGYNDTLYELFCGKGSRRNYGTFLEGGTCQSRTAKGQCRSKPVVFKVEPAKRGKTWHYSSGNPGTVGRVGTASKTRGLYTTWPIHAAGRLKADSHPGYSTGAPWGDTPGKTIH